MDGGSARVSERQGVYERGRERRKEGIKSLFLLVLFVFSTVLVIVL